MAIEAMAHFVRSFTVPRKTWVIVMDVPSSQTASYGISHIVFPLDISPYFVGGHITGIITINYIINIPLYTIISS